MEKLFDQLTTFRKKADALIQLVEKLNPNPCFITPMDAIPNGWSLEEFVEEFEKHPTTVLKAHRTSNDPIQTVLNPELANCLEQLKMAKAFAGKIMGELGKATPYANDGKRKTVADIEPTADRPSEEELDFWPMNTKDPENEGLLNWNHIEKVDFLRQAIDQLIKMELYQISTQLKDWTYVVSTGDLNDKGVRISLFEAEVMAALTKARFWLGFELERIQKNEKETRQTY